MARCPGPGSRLGAALGAALVAGTVGSTAVLAQEGEGPYAPYAGSTVVAMWPAHPHFDAAMRVLEQFTEETGIRVEVDQQQYLAMREKQTLELTKNSGDYDLIGYVVFSKADYVYADQIDNLARYFMNPALADPSYEPEDLIDGYLQNIGVAGGKKGYLPGPTGSLYGVPFGSETSVLAYREDIFDKHGLEPPETYEEMLDLACRIEELEPGMAGMASRGQSGHQTSHAFLLHLAPYGGRVLDDQYRPIVNDEAGVKAAEALKRILDCGPDGATKLRVRRGQERLPDRSDGDVPRLADRRRRGQRSVEEPGGRQGRLRPRTRWPSAAARRPVASGSPFRATPRTRKRPSC